MSCSSSSSRGRRPSPSLQTQRSRGPHRHRWERGSKHHHRHHYSYQDTVFIGLGLLLFSCFSIYWTWPAVIEVKQAPSISSQRRPPLRGGRLTHPLHIHEPHSIEQQLNNNNNQASEAHPPSSFLKQSPTADAVVVGSGLAGLTAALQILDRGGKVTIVEKEPFLGGNSNKASSGINGCCFFQNGTSTTSSAVRAPISFNPITNDTLELFYQDTFRSAGDVADVTLIETLVQQSAPALQWLQERVGVDLAAPLVQLGGHSRKRTHRPTVGFVGAEIMTAMETAIRHYELTGYARILVEHKVTNVVKDALGRVRGVQVQESTTNAGEQDLLVRSDNVILATGGFASDRSEGSLLRQYRPELQNMAATAGLFSTGDGIHLAQDLGATTRDMDKIQIHPTGFVDPGDPTSTHKTLAAELLRGVGGILLDKNGHRFCNELGTRDYVTDKMLAHEDDAYKESRTWNPDTAIPTFYLLLSAEAVRNAERHVGTYMRKGLITRIQGVTNLAKHLSVPQDNLASTLREYQSMAVGDGGGDAFGRTSFEGLPGEALELEDFYVGEVTPVLHYCMGGVKITPLGEVIGDGGSIIPGLYAVGEVTGGVHGSNRLGGNSLLECAVFGTIVGKKIPVNGNHDTDHKLHHSDQAGAIVSSPNKLLPPQRKFSLPELSDHSTPTDCFVALHGKVYDLTTFLQRHAGGSESILSLCGREATDIFSGVHSANILNTVDSHVVGMLPAESIPNEERNEKPAVLKQISQKDLALHNSPEDCWVVLHGNIYDLTEFSKGHPGGAYIIQKMAGKDATSSYQVFHPKEKLKMIKPYIVGELSLNAH